jgi:hypothetical protein
MPEPTRRPVPQGAGRLFFLRCWWRAADCIRLPAVVTPVRTRSPWLFAGLALAGFVIFGYATGVLMEPAARVIGDRIGELTCLQLAFTPERAAAVLASFPPEQRAVIPQLLLPGDIVFAWGYGLLLAGLLGLVTLRLPAEWQRLGWVITWTPLLASALDVTEDLYLHGIATAADPLATGSAALFAGLAASLKYFFLSGVAPAYGIVASLKAFTVDRRWWAVLLYLFTVANCLAFIARPLQQIPNCF